jgi:chloride channel 3/4/5
LYAGATGILGYVKQLADASQVWIILVAAGILSGGIAAFIDVASDWLADLKTGYCHNVDGDGRFWLNKSFCCWGIEEEQSCHDWNSWGAAMGLESVGGRYVVEYIFFVLYSVLFAACASLLVREFSPYASHSGIPEIKTVLGGFVIRHFLGGWTLLTKTIGLVGTSHCRMHVKWLTLTVSRCRIRSLARQGRPAGPCGMLFSESLHEAIQQRQRQRRSVTTAFYYSA